MEDLKKIGRNLGNFYKDLRKLLSDHDINEEDLEKFEEYCECQQAAGPLLNPSFYVRRNGFSLIEAAYKRSRLAKTILKHFEKDRYGLLD